MPEHKFQTGHRLFLARSVGLNVSDGPYIVVRRFPARDGEFEYRIKSANEPHERVVRESQLERTDAL